VPCLDQQGNQPLSDHAGRAGKEYPHDPTYRTNYTN